MMELFRNMEFEIKDTFIPNFSQSETLRITNVTDESVLFKMDESGCKGVFPIDSFHYWIKKKSLIPISETKYDTLL